MLQKTKEIKVRERNARGGLEKKNLRGKELQEDFPRGENGLVQEKLQKRRR